MIKFGATKRVIVIGGGIAGLSAAHEVLARKGSVLLLDKSSRIGGNSVLASSGFNAARTKDQIAQGIKDSPDSFYQDTFNAAKKSARPHLIRTLTDNSVPALEWLRENLNIKLDVLSRLGGHSFPRTHGEGSYPGELIVRNLESRFVKITETDPEKATLLTKTPVTQLITENHKVVGVEFQNEGKISQAFGPVIIATGGYAADFGPDSLLSVYRPDLLRDSPLTSNKGTCTGDGIKMAEMANANLVDMQYIQLHPTGIVDPRFPAEKTKVIAAESLRGEGALIIDRYGNRFVNELGLRDDVSKKMNERKDSGPFRLVLNSKGAQKADSHCQHYMKLGLMVKYENGSQLAAEMGIKPQELESTFSSYNQAAQKGSDEFGKKYFENTPFSVDDTLYVSLITPVLHYCMGGIEINQGAQVIDKSGAPIEGLWCAGEANGGIHGENWLGGNSLLDCVVFGRIAGENALNYLNKK
eukprot:TRINITY_DN6165_c0_g1_i1.p1 TRINITY_DN6165_c0_g1~~TRINITY_DN6165_c0_g1_i1.p1  ORF type:complete len:470 (-),score=92.77 TRINITY_DN6165_c0_g1_i1:56-1465(-)